MGLVRARRAAAGCRRGERRVCAAVAAQCAAGAASSSPKQPLVSRSPTPPFLCPNPTTPPPTTATAARWATPPPRSSARSGRCPAGRIRWRACSQPPRACPRRRVSRRLWAGVGVGGSQSVKPGQGAWELWVRGCRCRCIVASPCQQAGQRAAGLRRRAHLCPLPSPARLQRIAWLLSVRHADNWAEPSGSMAQVGRRCLVSCRQRDGC